MLVNSSKADSGACGPVGPFMPAPPTGANMLAITPRAIRTVPDYSRGPGGPSSTRPGAATAAGFDRPAISWLLHLLPGSASGPETPRPPPWRGSR